uniref:Uncharacterized protein n=1 Tax=Plectus sambesii TaxID=2011161 RepID=A0A914V234_9BILA
MIITGTTVIYGISVVLCILIMLGIFVKRQIQRLTGSRHDAPYTPIGTGLSKARKQPILRKIEAIGHIRKNYVPKFNDPNSVFPENAAHQYRMMALDEIHEIDQWLEYASCPLVRSSNQSLFSFLRRLKDVALSELDDEVIQRLAYLQEWARYRAQVFGEEELAEVRLLLRQLQNMINREHVRLAALHLQKMTSLDSSTDTAEIPLLNQSKNGNTEHYVGRKRKQSSRV